MIIYANSRQSGKTTRAIRMASSTGSVLLVPNKAMASYTKRYADELGYPVEIITYKDLQKNIRYGGKFLKGTKVVIDELDMVLRDLFGLDVIMATTTGMNLDGELYKGYTAKEENYNAMNVKTAQIPTRKQGYQPKPDGKDSKDNPPNCGTSASIYPKYFENINKEEETNE